MSVVSVDFVSRTMQVVLERSGRQIVYDDPSNGTRLKIDAGAAGAPEGFLPAFVVAGEAVWLEAAGKGFALDIVRDSSALLGYRLRGIGAGNFATVMLASMEAMHQVMRPEAIVVSDFNRLWSSAVAGIRLEGASIGTTQGLRP